MEDRYLFKAKRVDNGEWVKGSYLYDYGRNIHYIFANEIVCPNCINDCRKEFSLQDYEVDPSTICQCTGLKDKNGKLIWENDIVKDKHGNFYKAFWQDNYYQFSWICIKSDNKLFIEAKWNLWSFKSFEIEVIGNIFENPELLESEG